MAILKHIKSRNANYSESLEYLLFQHDESNGKAIKDEQGRMILREEYFIDGLNCDPMTFDKECEILNDQYHKNQKWDEIKSHHYIISYDPKDKTEKGLTGEQAHKLSLEYAKKYFPGYQALVVTHTDGHHASGNIHTHIVINSIRKMDVKREEYMDQPNDHKAGFKHRQTKGMLHFLQKGIMEMCEQEGLHQVNLLSPAPIKITNEEYWVKQNGQRELDQRNERIKEAGLIPTKTVFQTQKDELRRAIDETVKIANSFDEFQDILLEKYKISVTEKRGRYRYLHPDRIRNITGKALGANYDKDKLIHQLKPKYQEYDPTYDYSSNPIAILYVRSNLRLVTDLQTNVKAMQNRAYARKVELSNLKKMAETVLYVQENGYDTQEDVIEQMKVAQLEFDKNKGQIVHLKNQLRELNMDIRSTGKYLSNKSVYRQMIQAKNKKVFRDVHAEKISEFEEARRYLKQRYPSDDFPKLDDLKEMKEQLLQKIAYTEQLMESSRNRKNDMNTIVGNINSILENTSFKQIQIEKKYEQGR